MPTLAALLLAGGRGQRMGHADKALTILHGEPLLMHCLKRLQLSSQPFEQIAINANGNPNRFDRFGLPVLADTIGHFEGPLAGILAGLEWADHEGVDAILTLPTDTIFFPKTLPRDLANSYIAHARPVIAASQSNKGEQHLQPMFGIWPSSLHSELRAFLETGERKARIWAKQQNTQILTFSQDGTQNPAPQGDAFFNINTVEDLTVAESFIRNA